MTAHSLIKFINSPKAYKDGEPFEYRASNVIGAATHTCLLEGPHVYRERYRVDGPVNKTTGKHYGMTSQRFQKFAGNDQYIVNDATHELIKKLFDAVWGNPDALALIHKSQVEMSILTEMCGFLCQSRLDVYRPGRFIADLKTIEDLDQAEWQKVRYRYLNQMAFYRSMVWAVTDEILPVYLIWAEKKDGHRVRVEALTTQELDRAEQENSLAFGALLRCRETGEWPERLDLQKEMW